MQIYQAVTFVPCICHDKTELYSRDKPSVIPVKYNVIVPSGSPHDTVLLTRKLTQMSVHILE